MKSLFTQLKIDLIFLVCWGYGLLKLFKINGFGLIGRPLSSLELQNLLLQGAQFILRRLNTRIGSVQTEFLPTDTERPYIYMSNHESYLDIVVIHAVFPGTIRFIMKQELAKIPFFGYCVRHYGSIFIDRNNPALSASDIQDRAKDGTRIWIFPEGRRSRNQTLLEFKLGAFRIAQEADAIIIPVSLRGTGHICPPDKRILHLGREVQVRVGSPIDTRNYLPHEIHRLREDTRLQIANGTSYEPKCIESHSTI